MNLSGDVAQLGERQLCKLDVEGSSPFISTKKFPQVRELVTLSDLLALLGRKSLTPRLCLQPPQNLS